MPTGKDIKRSSVTDQLGAMDVSAGKIDNGAEDTKSCASCGKCGGDDAVKLKQCTACKYAWYCNASCQRAHRKAHVKECKLMEKELLEMLEPTPPEGTLWNPTPRPDCDICMIKLPVDQRLVIYNTCCGKTMCAACIGEQKRIAELGGFSTNCPYCRAPVSTQKETMERLKKLADQGDSRAMNNLALYHLSGKWGLPKDEAKAVQFLLRAVELGSASAHYRISEYYLVGKMGLERNVSKAKAFLEVAAKSGDTGDVGAYFALGDIAYQHGETDLALKHWRMSAKGGLKNAVDKLIKCHQEGLISKRSLEESMRARHDALEEIRSEERDRYVALARKNGEEYFQYC